MICVISKMYYFLNLLSSCLTLRLELLTFYLIIWGAIFEILFLALDVHRIGTPDYTISDIFHFGVSTSFFDFTDEKTGYGYRMNLSMGVNQNQFNSGVLFHLKYFGIAYNYYREKLLKRDGHIRHHVFTFAWYF